MNSECFLIINEQEALRRLRIDHLTSDLVYRRLMQTGGCWRLAGAITFNKLQSQLIEEARA